MTRNLFCFGLGYSALALARRLRDEGWSIAGTARASDKCRELAREDYAMELFDGLNWPDTLQLAVERADTILISVPPGEEVDPVLRAGADRLRPLVSRWRWLGYLSTTGIYGDKKGAWVDETTTPDPSNPRSARRLAAEIAWQVFAARTHAPLHIFRLAGIYGPGRNPLEAIRAGTARRFDKPGQIFSRIHVEDLATVLAASIAHPSPGAVYNVCDDEPASQADVIAYGAVLLGLTPPPLEPYAAAEPGLSEMARSFYRESKRVRNDRMKRELGIRLAFPTYREGLRALK